MTAEAASRAKRFTVVTIHPEMIASPFAAGVVGRAAHSGLISLAAVNPRDFTDDKHRRVDDLPFGGGPGMVMKYQPLAATMRHLLANETGVPAAGVRRILLAPSGAPFTQARARDLATYDHLILVCGRYEGIDQRFIDHHIDEELSLGDYVLSGGELAAMVVIDAVARLLPGVLGDDASSQDESFAAGLLEYPQYTRPAVIEDLPVPEVLQSGHHAQVATWRYEQALWRTATRRPDLWRQYQAPTADVKKWPAALKLASRVYLCVPAEPDVALGQQIASHWGLPGDHVICSPQLAQTTADLAQVSGDEPSVVAASGPFSEVLVGALSQVASAPPRPIILQVLHSTWPAVASLALDHLLGRRNA